MSARAEPALSNPKHHNTAEQAVTRHRHFDRPMTIKATDTNVLDRAKSQRNAAVSGAIARTRSRLRDAGVEPRYDRELLAMHTQAIGKFGRLVPFLIATVTLLGMAFGPGLIMALWAVGALAGYYVLDRICTVVSTRLKRGDPLLALQRWMLLGHAISGAGWVALSLFDCSECGPNEFTMYRAVVILIAMAVTAILCSALNRATLFTFIPAVVVFAALATDWTQKTHALSSLLLLTALPFFSVLGQHLQSTTLNLISLRAEKEFLITELEIAKAHSDEARRRAEDANLAKSRFLASMSHELRTPLNAILGFSEVMAREVLGPLNNPTYRAYSEDIRKSGEHLLTLINEILDLSRIEAGRYELNETELALADNVDECCRMLDIRIRGKDIRILRDYDATLPLLRADETSVRQVILNLLGNAIKFTPNGGQLRIRIGWTSQGGQYVSVIDNGPGIPEDELDLVLTAFRQGSIAIKNAEQGAGLGLPIVQAIMQMHGGSLKLKSRLREGTEATVIFPVERTVLPAEHAEEAPTAA
jgi:two-component system cell cycle sensor histidine kinase PleC